MRRANLDFVTQSDTSNKNSEETKSYFFPNTAKKSSKSSGIKIELPTPNLGYPGPVKKESRSIKHTEKNSLSHLDEGTVSNLDSPSKYKNVKLNHHRFKSET